jgi:hypothetical protein
VNTKFQNPIQNLLNLLNKNSSHQEVMVAVAVRAVEAA